VVGGSSHRGMGGGEGCRGEVGGGEEGRGGRGESGSESSFVDSDLEEGERSMEISISLVRSVPALVMSSSHAFLGPDIES